MANITFSEGSGLNDSIFGKSQAPIRMFIERKAEGFENISILKELFMMDQSKNWAEKYTSNTAMDGFNPVGENGKYPTDGMQEGYAKTLEHVTWKNSFSVSREMAEDSKLLDLKKQPAAFVKAYYRTREDLGAALFGAAMNAQKKATFRGKEFDVTGADEVTYFHTAHKSKVKGAAQSNCFSDAFSQSALDYAESAMQNFKGENNELLAVAPHTIIIPNDAALKRKVFEVIGADKDSESSQNGFNYQFGRWNVIVWNYLNQYISSGNMPWILADLDYNKEYGGAIFVDRTNLDVRSTLDEGTDANVWRGYARFTAGFNDWRAYAVCGVAGGTQLVPAAAESSAEE